MDEMVYWHTHKLFRLPHVTVADPDSSDSSRLYPDERYRSGRYASIYFNIHKIFAQLA